jgi:transposase
MRRYEVTDEQWRRLEPLLPPAPPRTGRPNHDHRRIVNGILWIHRTGSPWRDLLERYGPWGTVSSRFFRWRAAGVSDRLLEALQAEADARGKVDWRCTWSAAPSFGPTNTLPALVALAASGGEALGRSQGGFSTKLHLRADGNG